MGINAPDDININKLIKFHEFILWCEMTFIISRITQNGISMASDSNITIVKGKKFTVTPDQISKTEYCDEYHIGISIWGKLKVGGKRIWEYLKEKIDEYFDSGKEKDKLPDYLAIELNKTIPAEQILKLHKDERYIHKLGIHLSTYINIKGNLEPVLYHITNDRSSWKFIAQPDIHPISNLPPYMIFNGIYKPFACAMDFFIKYMEKISSRFQKIIKHYPDIQSPEISREDKLKRELKLLITIIRHYQAILEFNGLKSVIGGEIRGICFTENELVKKLVLEEI